MNWPSASGRGVTSARPRRISRLWSSLRRGDFELVPRDYYDEVVPYLKTVDPTQFIVGRANLGSNVIARSHPSTGEDENARFRQYLATTPRTRARRLRRTQPVLRQGAIVPVLLRLRRGPAHR